MTACFYGDCKAVAPNGDYTLEARSPHNGTINYKDGRAPSENDYGFKYRDHQGNFRYQLIDNTRNGFVRWERWQERGEDSPHEVVVSNDGWSILRTHGFKPEVIAVSPEGEDVIRVKIAGPKDEDEGENDAAGAELDRQPQRGISHLWRAAPLQFTTAGCYWTAHSWRYFFRVNRINYFAWRPSWGRRLVIDLTKAALLDEVDQRNSALSLAMKEAEAGGAFSLLSDVANNESELQQLLARRRQDLDSETQNPLLEKLQHVTSAIHIAGVHRVVRCAPLLRRLEHIDLVSYSTGTTAMGGDWWVEVQHFRPILHHALRLLGEEPQGYTAYYFTKNRARFPITEHVTERRERASLLNLSMDAQAVLGLLGSPDHVRKEAHKVERSFRWTEDWDYDFRVEEQWVTLRITWEEDDRRGRIARFEEVPSPWLHSDQRETEILGHSW